MSGLSIDQAAWHNRWRTRSVGEKALLSLGLLLVAMVARSPVVYAAVVGVFLLSTICLAGIPALTVLRVWALPLGFVFMGLIAIVFTVGPPSPDALWSWHNLSVSQESLGRAVLVFGRTTAAMSAVLLLALTTPMSDLLGGLRRIGLPAFLVEIAALIYRFVFLLLASQAAIRESQAARLGYSSRRRSLRSLGGLSSAVLLRAWTRAQRLEAGLAGRGYAGTLPVTGADRPISPAFVVGSLALVSGLFAVAVVVR